MSVYISTFSFQINTEMNSQIPFAVVGSTDFVRVGNKMVRARQYPWGTVQGKHIGFSMSHTHTLCKCAWYRRNIMVA